MGNHRTFAVVLVLVIAGFSAVVAPRAAASVVAPSTRASVVAPSLRASAASNCPDYEIIGSRGSGTAPGSKGWGDGLGLPGQAFAKAFQDDFPGSDVSVVYNPYPAVGILPSLSDIAKALGLGLLDLPAHWRVVRDTLNGVGALARSKKLGAYAASVQTGETDLKKMIKHACSTTDLILVGYSQGAQVTGDVFQSLTAAEKSKVVEVALFGDPRYNPKDSSDYFGLNSPPKQRWTQNQGILSHRKGFNNVRVLSFCHRSDPICQGLGQLWHGEHAHENYTKFGEPELAANFLVQASQNEPSNISPPQLDGTIDAVSAYYEPPVAEVGNDVYLDSPGTWTGSPTRFTYQWQRCTSDPNYEEFNDCVNIPGETSGDYTLSTADLGYTITVEVTAHNSWGSGSSWGTSYADIGASAPGLYGNVGAPNSVDGDSYALDNGYDCSSYCDIYAGDDLTAEPDGWEAWGGVDSINFTYQWMRCETDNLEDTCTSIGGATGQDYVTTSDDIGYYMKVVIRGSNAYGANGLGFLVDVGYDYG